MSNNILAVLFDCGDTLIDEGSEVHDPNNVVLQADLIPGAGELLREIKRRGYRLGLVADGKASSFKNNFRSMSASEVVSYDGISFPQLGQFASPLSTTKPQAGHVRG